MGKAKASNSQGAAPFIGILSVEAILERVAKHGVTEELVWNQNFGDACVSLVEDAKKWKDEGNKAFNSRKFKSAVEHYQKVVQGTLWIEQLLVLDVELSNKVREQLREGVSITGLAYSNAALSHSRLGDNAEVVNAATKALNWDPANDKALYRRGMAHLTLKHGLEAKNDLKDYLIRTKFENGAAKNSYKAAKEMHKQQKKDAANADRRKNARRGSDSSDGGPPVLQAAHDSDSDEDGDDDDLPGLEQAESSASGSDSDSDDVPARNRGKGKGQKKTAQQSERERLAAQKASQFAAGLQKLNTLNDKERLREADKKAKKREQEDQQRRAKETKQDPEVARQVLQKPEVRRQLIEAIKNNQDPRKLPLPFEIPPALLLELHKEVEAEVEKERLEKKQQQTKDDDGAPDLVKGDSSSSGDDSDSDSSSDGARKKKKAKKAKKPAKAAADKTESSAPDAVSANVKAVPESRDFVKDFIEKRFKFNDAEKTPNEEKIVSTLIQSGYSPASAEVVRPMVAEVLKEKGVFRFQGEAKVEPAANGGKPTNSAGKAQVPQTTPLAAKSKKEVASQKSEDAQAKAAAAAKAHKDAEERARKAAEELLMEEDNEKAKQQEQQNKEKAKAEKNRQKKEREKKKKEEEKRAKIQQMEEEEMQKRRIEKARLEEEKVRKAEEEKQLLAEAEKESLARKKREDEEKKKKRKEEDLRKKKEQQREQEEMEQALEKSRKEAEKKAKKEQKKASKKEAKAQPCNYGRHCKRVDCHYSHPDGREIDEAGAPAECTDGFYCMDMNCTKFHPHGRCAASASSKTEEDEDVMRMKFGVEGAAKTDSDGFIMSSGGNFTHNGDTNDDLDECMMCMEADKFYCMVPCGHKLVCKSCAHLHFLARPKDEEILCPICQVKLTGKRVEHWKDLEARGVFIYH